MEIKKQPTKIIAQKKEPESPEIKPEPIQPSEIPKVKPETDVQKINEAEDIKSKREQMFEQARIKQIEIRKNAVIAKKQRRIFQITILITMTILFLFAPIYPNQKISMNKRYYLNEVDIAVDHPLGAYFSPYQFFRYESEIKNSSEYIKKAKVQYNLREMKIVVNITEYKPLVKDVENNIYFYEDNEVVKKSDLDLYAPIITGFDQKQLEALLENLQTLDYDVITQIDTIEYIGTEDDPDLLKMGMIGDNTIYIDIEQIGRKLPYYNQIKQIIDEKADGKPGIIHLNVGDYYEPK